jgi:hypothetical protein
VSVYDLILDHMVDNMLDPALHADGVPSAKGNVVRKQVLIRALAAAKAAGWELTIARVPRAEPISDHRPTHAFVAQRVRLIEQDGDDHFLVEFSDGSMGWHTGRLVPLSVIE